MFKRNKKREQVSATHWIEKSPETMDRILTNANQYQSSALQKLQDQRRAKSREQWLKKAAQHSSSKQWSKAIVAYQSALAITSADKAVWSALANAYYNDGQFLEAAEYYEGVLKLDTKDKEEPHNNEIMYRMAEAYENGYDYNKAIESYYAIIMHEGNKAPAWVLARPHFLKGQQLLNVENFEVALRFVEQALDIHPSGEDILCLQFQITQALVLPKETSRSSTYAKVYQDLGDASDSENSDHEEAPAEENAPEEEYDSEEERQRHPEENVPEEENAPEEEYDSEEERHQDRATYR